ncbi:YcgL domain-containing protein [Aliikangiella marina]|uniref:YcgL domain-containing protein FLL45_03320 n=1 Tax=Aliikangiella marina TaxID=1712262 RepID=A0A545TIF6_9GAMM|nr:YcgL domain-containing protein [Aliikangiella marina]TQV76997.1 YcgL domain-containing protein [Aliikangiella marina]
MLASVYRSNKKDEMYLYVVKKDDFSSVPEALLKVFGQPEFALQLNLGNRESLARADINEVKQQLKEEGFYLQMPPSIHDNQADLK